MSIFKDWFTESDNKTHDLPKVLAALAIVTGIGLEIYAVGHSVQFDIQAYGIGVGGMFGGLGALLGFKKETQP